MRFSIIVPTLNRPALLAEALASIAAQDYDDWEAVVVDDGSDPPVSLEVLSGIVGPGRIKLVRHDERRGIPVAKNAGLERSNGDVVVYLDDDDLLIPRALSKLRNLFRSHPTLDCIFLNVEPFGLHAEGTREYMEPALKRLLDTAVVLEDEELFYFGPGAFGALVKSVPLPMQRPAARRSVWNMLGGYCETVAFSEPEWTMRAARSCRIALTKEPLQFWRVDGQNAYSRPDLYKVGIDAGVQSIKFLLTSISSQRASCSEQISIVQKRLAKGYLDRAWHVWEKGMRTDFEALWLSFLTRPSIAPLRLLFRHHVLSILKLFRMSPNAKTD